MIEIAARLGLRPQDLRKLGVALSMILVLLVAGVLGFMYLAGLSPIDAFYMTIITVSTVGFGEFGDFNTATRLFASVIIIFTLVWGVWALQSLLSTFISPRFITGVRQYQAIRKANTMENHTIVCGFGRIGRAVVDELQRSQEPFLIIDDDAELVERIRAEGLHVVQGDATEDEILLAAGILRARRLVSVLDSDNANIVTVLSARELNRSLWIASRIVQPATYHKLLRAGANEVVSPYEYGGRRLALTMLRPYVSQFLSEVVFDEGRGAEMDEIVAAPGSKLVDRTLGETRLRSQYGVTVIALYHPGSPSYQQPQGWELNPGPDTVLHEGDVLIVVGVAEQLATVHAAVGA